MARSGRRLSASGVYHIVLRGINKQTIFYDDEDREVFLNRMKLAKKETPCEIYAFCLMSNHIHMLVREKQTTIGKVYMKLLSSYVYWYNRKYERIGNLFQDRYKSEPIEADSHLLCCLRYIHQNPVKAGMVKEVGDYAWSSHELYMNGKESFVDTELLTGMLNDIEGYADFVKKEEKTEFLENDKIPAISDEKLVKRIQDICLKYKIKNILELEKGGLHEILLIIRQIPGASIRQISRVTGVPISIVRYIQ